MISRRVICLIVCILASAVRYGKCEYYKCNVCQNSDEGERYLADPSESFVNPSTGDTWTCGFLQEAMQDVDPTSSGAAGEAYLCSVYQITAEQYCTCNGPDVPSLLDGPYEDPNAACNLCTGYALTYVPYFRSSQTVDTGKYGNQNCIGLYEAALYGNLFDEDSCQSVTAMFGPCCSLPDIPDHSGGGGGGGESDNNGNNNNNGNNGGDASSGSRSSPRRDLLLSIVGVTLSMYFVASQ
jgi:hypothetical protein